MTARSETAAGRKAALRRGLALPPASPGAAPGFPVTDPGHWDKARMAVGRVKDPARRARLASLLRKTAPRFGKTGALKGSWAAKGSKHSNTMAEAITLSSQMQCPRCGYKSDDADFKVSGGTSDTSDPGKQSVLRTPANQGLQSSTGYSPSSAGVNVRSGAGGAGLANGHTRSVNLSRRTPVTSASDVIVARGDDGSAVIRHRRGGTTIGRIWHGPEGWKSALDGGQEGQPRTHQRSALADLIGGWNKGAPTAFRKADTEPLQPPPRQTPLMEKFGVPAIRALATPTTSASGGPRVTMSSSDPDNDGDNDSSASGDTDNDGGLNPKGQAVLKKLLARGWPRARAMAFAKRAQNMTSGSFKKAG